MRSIEVEILGKKYYLKSDNPDKLKDYVNYLVSQLEKLDKKYNTIDQNKLFVLYSLKMTEMYFNEIEKNKRFENEKEQIDSLLNQITLDLDK